jgi:hypothetical protein
MTSDEELPRRAQLTLTVEEAAFLNQAVTAVMAAILSDFPIQFVAIKCIIALGKNHPEIFNMQEKLADLLEVAFPDEVKVVKITTEI